METKEAQRILIRLVPLSIITKSNKIYRDNQLIICRYMVLQAKQQCNTMTWMKCMLSIMPNKTPLLMCQQPLNNQLLPMNNNITISQAMTTLQITNKRLISSNSKMKEKSCKSINSLWTTTLRFKNLSNLQLMVPLQKGTMSIKMATKMTKKEARKTCQPLRIELELKFLKRSLLNNRS